MEVSKTIIFLITVYVFILTHSRTVESKFLIRKTKYGKVRGFTTDLAQVFQGIPFADPPERWTAPVDPTPWTETLDARQVKANCYYTGSCSAEIPFDCVPEISEDCLYLNIFAPLGSTRKTRKAVMVWLHGGSFDSGTAGSLVYNAEMLANKGDVIVVTANYRLGAFGFLVTGNSSNDITGNYGIMDQRQALKWVNKNIRFFGGDREQVTLFGQSAGADSVAIHLMSGKVDKYFQRAIMQSAPFTIPLKPVNVAIEQGVKFGIYVGCEVADSIINVTCLRELPADTIANAQGRPEVTQFSDSPIRSFIPWIPHIDGDEIKSGLIEGLLKGDFSPKPVVIGTVADEGVIYIRIGFKDPINFLAMVVIVATFAPSFPTEAFDLYPISNPFDTRNELSDITTDYVFACPTRMIARELSKRMPVYSYVFDEPFPVLVEAYINETYCNDKSCHGLDVPSVFQSARMEPLVFDNDELAFSDKMLAYWSNFAKYGNPNRKLVNGTEWTRYRTTGKKSDTILELRKTEVSNQRNVKSEVCDLMDLSGY